MELTDRAGVALVVTEEPIPASEGAALRRRASGDYGHRTTEVSLGPLAQASAEKLLTDILGDDVEPGVRTRLVQEAKATRSI